MKTSWEHSENAVRTHLWVAIFSSLIIAKIKADYKSPYSITEVATLIRISALERVDLRDLTTKPKDSLYSMIFNNRAILSHQYYIVKR